MERAMRVVVLRMGHRVPRDYRLTTHVCLTARAFGADGVVVSDVVDRKLEETIRKVVKTWGGPFFVETGVPWREVIKDWLVMDGEVVHLTQYGLPLVDIIDEVRKSRKDKLVVVGAKKQPREVYELATYNISVTNQPHSEVAALCLFLHYLWEGEEFKREFVGAKLKVIPQSRGKKVVRLAE
ncbi:MAG: tRNA (cytidine(56)-2'-O)-methyltransferase [Candidatus Nezhaarchaeota archaeon]|nr:tRNA (cytidine(56)-2'-O)-methyltransferase [Candidatus Nezhaarchaeota archaeon]